MQNWFWNLCPNLFLTCLLIKYTIKCKYLFIFWTLWCRVSYRNCIIWLTINHFLLIFYRPNTNIDFEIIILSCNSLCHFFLRNFMNKYIFNLILLWRFILLKLLYPLEKERKTLVFFFFISLSILKYAFFFPYILFLFCKTDW